MECGARRRVVAVDALGDDVRLEKGGLSKHRRARCCCQSKARQGRPRSTVVLRRSKLGRPRAGSDPLPASYGGREEGEGRDAATRSAGCDRQRLAAAAAAAQGEKRRSAIRPAAVAVFAVWSCPLFPAFFFFFSPRLTGNCSRLAALGCVAAGVGRGTRFFSPRQLNGRVTTGGPFARPKQKQHPTYPS